MIIYRPVTVDDAGSYVAHMNRAGHQSDFLAFEGDQFYLTEPQARDVLDGYVRAGNQAFFVAERDGALVGVAMLESSPMARLRHAAELRIAVDRSVWGQGVAKTLMTMIGDFFDDSAILTRMSLKVNAAHDRGVALYRKFGFVEEGVNRMGMRVGNDYCDLLMMARTKAV